MMIENFIKGKYKLAIVFWVFGVLAVVAYHLASISIFNHLFKLSEYEHFQLGYSIFFALPFVYFPIVIIAVWNSASQYSGQKIWAQSAKVMMVLWIISLLYYAIYSFMAEYSSKITSAELTEWSVLLNKSLPQTVEPNVQLNKTSFNNNQFIYQYQIMNQVREQLHVKTFVVGFKPALKKQVCEQAFTRKVLNNHFLISYEYIDKNGEEIYTFTVKSEDCM